MNKNSMKLALLLVGLVLWVVIGTLVGCVQLMFGG